MAGFAAIGFRDSAGPVSPYLYWWTGERLVQVSKPGPDESLVIDGSGDFGDLLARLTGDTER